MYNLFLVLVVLGHFLAAWPGSRAKLSADLGLGLFVLAILANVFYCAAYVVDLFVQFSGLQDPWRRGRAALLTVGTAFAGVIAHFMSKGLFGP